MSINSNSASVNSSADEGGDGDRAVDGAGDELGDMDVPDNLTTDDVNATLGVGGGNVIRF